MRTSFAICAVLLAAVGVAWASEPGFTPGAWEITRERTGGPGGAERTTQTVCFAAETLVRDPAAPLKLQPQPQGAQVPSCETGPVTMNGGALQFQSTCRTPMGAIRIPWTGTYSPTGFQLTGNARRGLMQLSVRVTGRHIGACRAGP